MNDKLYQKCKTILSEGTTGLTDDQATCNKIEALLPLLSNIDFQISQEYLPIIQPGLRIILQYWTKGPPSQSNKWSKSCLGLATILALLLPIDKINNGADYSKYAKLLGFVLAKVTAMGPEEQILDYMEAIFRHFTVDSLKEINFANMVPIFFHLVVELISRRQSSNYENQKLGKLLIQCLDVGLLSFLISQGNMTDYCAEKSPQTKLLNSLIESSFHWTILVESSIIQNAASGCLMDLDICREKIYKIILCLYSPNIIVTILEMASRHLSSLKNDTKRIELLGAQILDFLSHLTEQRKQNCGIYSLPHSDEEIISKCRVILYLAYEFIAVIPKSTSKKQSAINCISEDFFQVVRSFILLCRDMLPTNGSRWEWSLFIDLLERSSMPIHFVSTQIDISKLTNLDKGLISKLVQLILSHFPSNLSYDTGSNHTIIFPILLKFVISSDQQILEYSSKLLSLSFQTILKSDEFSELVIVDIISVALSFLGESLCMNIPLVDYLIRMMPVAMAKISPSDQPIPQNNIVHNHLMEQITLFFCRSTMFILKKDVPCERMNLFYSIFPSIWIQCERMWAKNENLLPNIPKFLVVSNSLFGCLIEEISSSHREQLVTLFCRWVVYSLGTSPQDYKLDNEIQNLNGNHFTEMWLAHLVFELESKVGIEWEASVDWNSFSCRCKDLVETLTSHLATLFSISQDETFQLFNFSILSQIFWKYENRWKSEQCPLQYQIFSSTNHSTLGALPEVTSKKGKAKKINSVLCSISRFRHAVLRLRWKICERSYSVESVVLSQALSDDVLRDITITLDLFREISLLDNFHPIETYDLVDLCYQLHNIIGLHADFTLRLQLLESVHNLSENQLIDIYWRKSFQNFATDLKLLLLAWSLYNGCFDEYLLVDQTFAVDQHDTEFSLLFSEWISSASSLFLLINKRNIDFPDLETFKTSTENIFKLCRIGQHYLHGAWVSLLYSKLQLLLNGNFVESLSWSKQVLSLKLLDKRHQTLLGYLEIELETMLHICDIYDCLGSVEKCLSYLSEAKLLSCTGFGASTYLRHIYALHGLRIWKRTKSSRFSSELENGLFDKINSGSLLGKIRVNFEIIRDLDKFFSLEVNIQQKFQYRYMDMLWNVGTGSMSPPIYFAPLNLKIKPFLVPISSINLNTPSFSGFRRFSLESVQDILASEILLRSGYFDIERDYRRSVALNIVLKSLETSSSTSNISQGHADNFLVWFMIASSNNISIEKSLMNSELTRSNLPIISSLFQKVYEGDLNVLQHIRDNLLNSEKVICSVVLDHLSKQILITRLDQQQSFTVALGVNAFQEVTNLIMEWDEIMSANRTQLSQTTDPEKVLSWKAADKKRWWLERDNLDLRIERLLRDLEEKFGVWKCLLTSSNSFVISDGIVESIRSWIAQKHISKKESRSRLDSNKIEESLSGFLTWLKLVLSDGALADECEQITATQDLFTWISTVLCLQSTTEELLQLSIQIVREAQSSSHSKSQPIIQEPIEDITQRLSGLKVADLKEELKAHGLDTTGKKGELYNRLLEYFKSNQSPSDNAEEEVVSSDHLILILDESLQSIPFECLPALRSKSCSRVPSLLFLLHQLHQKEIHSQNLSKTKEKKKKNSEEEVVISPRHAVSLSKCWYSIDPEANLVSTRNNLMQFLEYYITKWNWKGFAGQQPPEDIVREYHESSDLFVYCGHGSGEKLFTGNNRLNKLNCPAAMLWGCSSGVLSRYGVHDPIGAPITYLLNGAPWVIGNLWDVTDKDIDKLSMTCMHKVFDDSNPSDTKTLISTSLCQSRDICKLKNAVGCAPVLYGVPIGIDYQ